jgi:hypothetical protein
VGAEGFGEAERQRVGRVQGVTGPKGEANPPRVPMSYSLRCHGPGSRDPLMFFRLSSSQRKCEGQGKRRRDDDHRRQP